MFMNYSCDRPPLTFKYYLCHCYGGLRPTQIIRLAGTQVSQYHNSVLNYHN